MRKNLGGRKIEESVEVAKEGVSLLRRTRSFRCQRSPLHSKSRVWNQCVTGREPQKVHSGIVKPKYHSNFAGFSRDGSQANNTILISHYLRHHHRHCHCLKHLPPSGLTISSHFDHISSPSTFVVRATSIKVSIFSFRLLGASDSSFQAVFLIRMLLLGFVTFDVFCDFESLGPL